MIQNIENQNYYKINLAIDYIHAHLEEPITLADLSKVCMISHFHFHKLFTSIIGETPMDYIHRQRVKRALYIMRTDEERSLTEIAFQLNFSSSSNFTRWFKNIYGISPRSILKNRQLPVMEKHHITRLGDNFLEGREIPYTFDPAQISLRTIDTFKAYYIRIYRDISIPRIGMVMYQMGWRAILAGVYRSAELVLALNETYLADDEASFDVCVHIFDPAVPMLNLNQRVFEGGLYAVYSFYGNPYATIPVWTDFYLDWLPASGYELSPRPAFQILTKHHIYQTVKDPISYDLYLPVQKIKV